MCTMWGDKRYKRLSYKKILEKIKEKSLDSSSVSNQLFLKRKLLRLNIMIFRNLYYALAN